MNIYVVVEGDTEKEVYSSWISQINRDLKYVDDISEIIDNNYAILSGGGYPQYFEIIDNAISDVNNHGAIDRFVISVDSEEMSRIDKYQEVDLHIYDRPCIANIYIVVQHFCLEAWALGNRSIFRKKPTNKELLEYMEFFNVKNEDPELLPKYNCRTRSQFAFKYLHKAVNDINSSMTYSKKNPKALKQPDYVYQLTKRLGGTGHISSFQVFLDAFNSN